MRSVCVLYNNLHSSARVLRRYYVPEECVKLKFIRSSGPGGQNVNKVATCVEARLDVKNASFLKEDIKKRLYEQEGGRINKEGELIVVVQDERTQSRNRAIALNRLSQIIEAASAAPKERKQWQGIGEKTKEKRRDFKRRRKEVKGNRRFSKQDLL